MSNQEIGIWAERATKFYYGDQYDPVTKNTKNLPRPVLNYCKLQVNSKISNLLAIPTKLRMCTNNDYQYTDSTTNFVNYLLKEDKWSNKKSKICLKAALSGLGVCHVYWNDKKIGTYGDYVGGVSTESINYNDIAFANPSNDDIQSQEYIIIRSRKSVKSLRNMVQSEEDKLKIVPEDRTDYRAGDEIAENDLCWTYLQYYRKDGEVYKTFCTKDVVIYKDSPLNPMLHVEATRNLRKLTYFDDLDNLRLEKNTDGENLNAPSDKPTEQSISEYQKTKFFLYPIALLTLNPSDNSIYGVSELRDSLNTQKYINHMYAYQLYNVMNVAFDKIIITPDALKGQKVTNEPGQVLVDYSRSGNGIRRLGGMNAMANGVTDLADKTFVAMRTANQFNDVLTGETQSNEMSGVLYSQMQTQNDKPIDEMRKRLWAFEEEIGRILEIFIKLYYSRQEFFYEMDDAELIEAQQNMPRTLDGNPNQNGEAKVPPLKSEMFDANIIRTMKFNVTVEAVQGVKNNDVQALSTINALFLNGAWNNMDIHGKEMFVEMYPFAEKTKLRALLNKQAKDYVSQVENRNMQLTQMLEQMQNTLNRASEAIKYQQNVNQSLSSQYQQEVNAHQKDNDKLLKQLVNDQSSGGSTSVST